jgi:hypothetical protein
MQGINGKAMKHFCVHTILNRKYIIDIGIAAEPLVPDSSPFEDGIVTAKLKKV